MSTLPSPFALKRQSFSQRSVLVRIWLLAIVFAGSVCYFLFQGGKLSFMLLIIMTLLSAYLVMGKWSGIRRAQGERRLAGIDSAGMIDAGTMLEVNIKLAIPGFWPIPYVLTKDHLLRHNGGEQIFEASMIPDWKRRGTMKYRTVPLRRGLYRFTKTDCATEDIFGFFEHKSTLTLEYSFRVMPRTTVIRNWNKLQMMLKGTHYHSTTVRALRETTQISGAREYNYGDRLSRIHWNATAKTGVLKSKEFERESLPKTILVLDRTKDHYADQEQFELAVSVVASLIDYGNKHNLAFGLLSTGASASYYEPKYGQSQHMEMLNHLIVVEADGHYPLEEILRERKKQLHPGTFVAVISPQSGERMQSVLSWVQQRQMSPCHLWIHSESGEKEQQWLKQLQFKGFTGYAIASLAQLPSALGGRG